jgi:DNA-binding transcriptional LysR family regulator
LRPRIAGEHDGADSLLAAVESGLGVALVSARTARLFPGRVQLKTLSRPPPPLCIAAGCKAERVEEKPLAVFLAELRHAAKNAA